MIDYSIRPHDDRAERQLISAVALYPDLWRDMQYIEPESFHLIEARASWAKLARTFGQGGMPDPVDYLAFHDPVYPVAPVPAVIADLARRVTMTSYQRAVIAQCGLIAAAAFAGDVEKIRAHLNAMPLPNTATETESLSAMASQLWDEIIDPRSHTTLQTTGLEAFDRSVGGGLEAGTSTVLMARPGMGKTAALAQISDLASERGDVVLVLSKEMQWRHWLRRMAARRAHVSVAALKALRASEDDRRRAAAELITISERTTLVVNDVARQTTDDVFILCDRLARKHGRLDLVIADHLRLFADRGDNETHRQGAISWAFKRIAKKFNTRCLVAAQLNRGLEGQTDRRPDLKDLRDSGEIEENADNVIALYREKYYDPRSDKTAEFISRKSRDGERNIIARAVFLEESMSFERGI